MRKKLISIILFAMISVSAISSLFMIAPSSDVEIGSLKEGDDLGLKSSTSVINLTEDTITEEWSIQDNYVDRPSIQIRNYVNIPLYVSEWETHLISEELTLQTVINDRGSSSEATHVEESYDVNCHELTISGSIPYHFNNYAGEWDTSIEFWVNNYKTKIDVHNETVDQESGVISFSFAYTPGEAISSFELIFHIDPDGSPPMNHPVWETTGSGLPALTLEYNEIVREGEIGEEYCPLIDNGDSISLDVSSLDMSGNRDLLYDLDLITVMEADNDRPAPYIHSISYPSEVRSNETFFIEAVITDASGVHKTEFHYGTNGSFDYSVRGNYDNNDTWYFLVGPLGPAFRLKYVNFYIEAWENDVPQNKTISTDTMIYGSRYSNTQFYVRYPLAAPSIQWISDVDNNRYKINDAIFKTSESFRFRLTANNRDSDAQHQYTVKLDGSSLSGHNDNSFTPGGDTIEVELDNLVGALAQTGIHTLQIEAETDGISRTWIVQIQVSTFIGEFALGSFIFMLIFAISTAVFVIGFVYLYKKRESKEKEKLKSKDKNRKFKDKLKERKNVELVECPNEGCGYLNPLHQKFCGKCGEELIQGEPEKPEIPCPNEDCKGKIKKGEDFCGECQSKRPNIQEGKKKSKKADEKEIED